MKKYNLPKVSFIIPTLNAASILPLCLTQIRNQNYPQDKIEIIVADGGSTDMTLSIARRSNAIIIKNPEILHEPGKDRASKIATGEILFFTDADNILSGPNWVQSMVIPYLENNKKIQGFMPQTLPAPNSNSLDRYMGSLSTDPFTWFVYRYASSPRTYADHYPILKKTPQYTIFKFDVMNHPLCGLSQGFGTIAAFKREKIGHSDDILAAIKLIAERGIIAYVPQAGIYHYHVSGISDFLKKYTWKIRNNFYQRVKGMGLINRQRYLNSGRRIRQILFVPYSLTLIFPIIDTGLLFYKYLDIVVLWHPIACLLLSLLMIKETFLFLFGFRKEPGIYGAK